MKKGIAIASVLVSLVLFCTAQVHIIPQPVSVKMNKGFLEYTSTTKIERTRNSSIKREGYILRVLPNKITIESSEPAGEFYAGQTLSQLVRHSKKIPCVTITDYPQYPYRGMHLDVSRHFFPVSFIKKYLDILAAYKINTFHWHLTDSHGWRLQIKQYPKLTEKGAWRADRKGIPMPDALPTQVGEKATYGGFYTQEEVKDIIRYARERFITIIPEIEMPGHCTAALVAYPQFSDLNNPVPLLMPTGYAGDLKHNFCAGYDSTYVFIENILKEVMALFPSEYIHIGGDEVRPEPWLTCPRCQQRMKEKGLTTIKQLQAYFTSRIDSFITANGRKTIGWEEILYANVSRQAVGMVWHTNEGAVESIRKGNNVVMMPYRYTYFDFYQSDPQLEENITYARLSLDSVYRFDPIPPGLTTEEKNQVLGGQACLWTENIETPARVEYMLLPRLLALCEALWTPANKKDYARFIDGVEQEFKYFDKQKISYARSMYNVSIMPEYDSVNKQLNVILARQVPKYEVRYSLNGGKPSIAYNKPITVKRKLILKSGLYDHDKLMGKINTDTLNVR